MENEPKIRPEDEMLREGFRIPDEMIDKVGKTYNNFYQWRTYRAGLFKHFRNYQFDEYLRIARELFWNSLSTDSDDLRKLGLELSIPFARKEVMDFLSKLTSLGVKPKLVGDNLDNLGLKILQGIYKKWHFKNNQKVEAFWELLYGTVNGTVCSYIGYNNQELQRRYLKSYNPETGEYDIEKKTQIPWNDVEKTIVPIEDIYLPKVFERNIQKQGKLIWRTQFDKADFDKEFSKYPLHKFVYPGMRIAEDSLFFKLLGGTGTTSATKIEVLREYDWFSDTFTITAGGLVLNYLGKGKNIDWSPMPFNHKMAPFVWGIMSPLDEKLAYGLSLSFQSKDPHKLLNTFYTMSTERELRAVDPAILSSDIESPELIFGQHRVIQVNDVNAYKEMKLSEPSNQYFNMMNSLQSNMSSINQGGDSKIIPSRQPDSARAVMVDNQEKQQAMANAITMYYDIIRQQVILVLKTALQFYTSEKYKESDKSVLRTLLVPDMPITNGGIGNLKIKIVNKKQDDMALFLEGIRESVVNGKTTEVIEVPVEFLQNIEFHLQSIELQPEKSTELELASFVENILQPMINTYVPMGLADPSKVMLRHMEKMGESVSDYVADQNVAKMMGASSMENDGAQFQNMMQMTRGVENGVNNLTTKYGMGKSLPLNK